MKNMGTELLIGFLITWMWFSTWHPWQVFVAAFFIAWIINMLTCDILNKVKSSDK